jgi:hypothetical protein
MPNARECGFAIGYTRSICHVSAEKIAVTQHTACDPTMSGMVPSAGTASRPTKDVHLLNGNVLAKTVLDVFISYVHSSKDNKVISDLAVLYRKSSCREVR